MWRTKLKGKIHSITHTNTHPHNTDLILYLDGVTMNTQNVFAMPGIEDVMIHLTIESDD